jgi:rhodanese-related sulfurtransferase
MSKPRLITLKPVEAYEKMSAEHDAVFVDIRSEMEFFFVGSPVGAVNIAWRDAPDWDINPSFFEEVAELADFHQPLYIICRSGVRTIEAGNALIDAGYQKVFNIGEGFEGSIDDNLHRGTLGGWRFHGLPWRQC